MNLRRKFFFSFLIFILLGGSFFGGFYFGKLQCKICPPEEIDFSLFWEAYHKLQEKFVDKGKIDIQKIIYGAISGMAKSLGDPYTVFYTPEEAKKFKEDIRGSFEGIGAEIGMRKGQLVIVAPLENSPAQKAGLRPGDKIIKINGILTVDLTLDEAVNLIRGPKGTEVTLTIFREGWDQPKEFKITRALIKVPSVKFEIKKTLTGEEIAYIKIFHFSENTSQDFNLIAHDEILKRGLKKIILDLRNNPGGILQEAENIASWFLKKDQVIVIVEGKTKEEHRTKIDGKFSDYPIVILINNGSASGSEIVAAALRDNRGVIIVGEKSFGKGSVQEQETLRDESLLKITTAKWLTPKGQYISDLGLEPDVLVKMTEEDYEAERDPQLEKAIEIIKNL